MATASTYLRGYLCEERRAATTPRVVQDAFMHHMTLDQ